MPIGRAGSSLLTVMPAVWLMVALGSNSSKPVTPTRTYMVDGGLQRLVHKPTAWSAGGVGASARMEDIHGMRWGPDSARATGTTVNNNCDPSCAGGTVLRYPGTMTLSQPATCRYGSHRYRFFTRVRYTITLPEGNGFGEPAGTHATTFTWRKKDLDHFETCQRR